MLPSSVVDCMFDGEWGAFDKVKAAAGVDLEFGKSVDEDHKFLEALLEFLHVTDNLAAVLPSDDLRYLKDCRGTPGYGLMAWSVLPEFLRKQCMPETSRDLGVQFERGKFHMVSRPFTAEQVKDGRTPFLDFIESRDPHMMGSDPALGRIAEPLADSHRVLPFRGGFVSCASFPVPEGRVSSVCDFDALKQERVARGLSGAVCLAAVRADDMPISFVQNEFGRVAESDSRWVNVMRRAVMSSLPISLPKDSDYTGFANFVVEPDRLERF